MFCKYNTHYYWDSMANSKNDIWRYNIMDKEEVDKSIFLNTTIINYKKGIIDNNWACYSEVKGILGFIQYIYLPTVFLSLLNKDNDIVTPICSSEEFIEYIKEYKFDKKYLKTMENNLDEVKENWYLSDEECFLNIKRFCNKFNDMWNKKDIILYINVFKNTLEIADNVMKEEFTEVVEEDIGISKNQLYDLCRDVHTNKFIKKTFVTFLNNNIGCIV